MSCRVASFALFAALVASVSAVDIEPSFVAREPRNNFVTATLFVTTTSKSVTTTVISTQKVCAALQTDVIITGADGVATTFSSTPSVACRRKRNFFPDDVFIGVANDDVGVQFYRLNPSQMLKFEPTLLPQFRQGAPKAPYYSPYMVEASFERQQAGPLDGRLFFGGQLSTLSSLVSAAVSNILTLTNTVTSTVTAYTSTFTSFSFTATTTYALAGDCIPAGVTTC